MKRLFRGFLEDLQVLAYAMVFGFITMIVILIVTAAVMGCIFLAYLALQ